MQNKKEEADKNANREKLAQIKKMDRAKQVHVNTQQPVKK
jgi:hypothetical protein